MSKKKGNPWQKAVAVILSAVLCTGLISGAAPVQAKAEERSSAASGASVEPLEDKGEQDQKQEITPIVHTPAELEADATYAVPIPRELEAEVLAGTTVEGIPGLNLSDYTLTASYDPDTQICTVSFALTDPGKDRYVLGTAAKTTAKCKVRFRVAKKEITPVISIPESMEFDASKGVVTEQNIKAELLKKVSVSGIDLLEKSDYLVDAVYDIKKGSCTVSFMLSSEGGEKYVLGENARTTAECRIIIRRTLADAVVTKIEKEAGAPDLKIVTGLPALTDAVLSAAEKEVAQTGTELSLVFRIRDIGNTLSSTDKAALGQGVKDYQVGQYLDISLFKVTGEKRSPVTKTAGKIRLTLTIPERLTGNKKNISREFALARVHEGKISVLQDLDTDSATVTADTDCFSVYAIVYKDAAGTGSTGDSEKSNKTDTKKKDTGKDGGETAGDDPASYSSGGEDAPDTGDQTPLEFYATIAMISGFTYVLLLFKKGSHGMSEEKKKELVSQIIRWACKGGQIRRILAYAAIVLLLVYYHSIGRKAKVDWEELTSK